MPEDSELHAHLGEILKSLNIIMLKLCMKIFLIALMDRLKLNKVHMMWTVEAKKDTSQWS
jgi:hypothetical protein